MNKDEPTAPILDRLQSDMIELFPESVRTDPRFVDGWYALQERLQQYLAVEEPTEYQAWIADPAEGDLAAGSRVPQLEKTYEREQSPDVSALRAPDSTVHQGVSDITAAVTGKCNRSDHGAIGSTGERRIVSASVDHRDVSEPLVAGSRVPPPKIEETIAALVDEVLMWSGGPRNAETKQRAIAELVQLVAGSRVPSSLQPEKRVQEARAILFLEVLRYTAHRDGCAHRGGHSTDCHKWQGFHEHRYLDDSQPCTCEFGRPCNCGLSQAIEAMTDVLRAAALVAGAHPEEVQTNNRDWQAEAFDAHNGMMAALAERDAWIRRFNEWGHIARRYRVELDELRAEKEALDWLVQWLQRALEGTERRLNVAPGTK